MERTLELFISELLHSVATLAIHLFEFVGVVIIIVAGVRGVCDWLRRDPQIRLNLARGMAVGLEFKLGSEIMRTVIVRDLSEIAIVGAIILMRAALTFLIQWEIRCEEAEVKAKELESELKEH